MKFNSSMGETAFIRVTDAVVYTAASASIVAENGMALKAFKNHLSQT